MSKGILEQITHVLQPQMPRWACELTSKYLIVAGVAKHRDRIEGRFVHEFSENVVAGSLSEPNIRNVDVARSRVDDALRQAGFRGSEITVVVPDDAVRIAFVTAENLSRDPDEQRAFIRWKLKKTVPFDVDSAQIAFRLLGPQHGGNGHSASKATDGTNMLVTLSPRPVVEEYQSLFESLGLHAGLVLPSTLAALNLFSSSGDSLFVKTAAECITTTIFQRGRIQFYRRVAEASLYDAVYPTVLYYQDKLGGSGFDQLFFCGHGSEDDPAAQSHVAELEAKLGLRAERLEPRRVEDIFKPVLGAAHLTPVQVAL